MRIAFVSFEYPPDSSYGGIATYVAQAAQLMFKRGHQVEVFASSIHRNESVIENNILVHWIKENDRYDFPVIAGHLIAKRHAEMAFDVIESPEYFADGRKAIELIPDLPLVVRLHTPSRYIINMSWPHTRWYPMNRLWLFCVSIGKILLSKSGFLPTINPIQQWQEIDLVEKKFTQQANRIVALCSDLKLFAEKKWQINPRKIVLSPNIYHPRKSLLEIEPRKNGITIGFFGRLERRKGIDLLVKAIPGILKSYPNARFRFVGKSQEYKAGVSYEDWIKKVLSKYINQLDFVGQVALNQMHNEYDLVDVCVFPSRWENFPNVCLEAMSAAKAIVGSKFGGMSEMMPSEQYGLLVNPNNCKEIIDAVCRLLANPNERITMGLSARDRVLSAYNTEIIGSEMETIFELAISDKKNTLK